MGGVARVDQMVGVYDLGRKLKWWKKVLYGLLMLLPSTYKFFTTNFSGTAKILDFVERLIEKTKAELV